MAPRQRQRRKKVGYSEGSRLLRQALDARGWTHRKAFAELGMAVGFLISGQRGPSLIAALTLQSKLGIEPASWTKPARPPKAPTSQVAA